MVLAASCPRRRRALTLDESFVRGVPRWSMRCTIFCYCCNSLSENLRGSATVYLYTVLNDERSSFCTRTLSHTQRHACNNLSILSSIPLATRLPVLSVFLSISLSVSVSGPAASKGPPQLARLIATMNSMPVFSL